MAVSNLKNTLIKQIKTLDPSIDTSPSSNFSDILINPLTFILSGYQENHDRLLKNLTLTDPASLQESELDAIGANFLVTRVEGTYHRGAIKLYFVNPTTLSIPANIEFTNSSTGLSYGTIASYNISKIRMSQNLEPDGLYSTDEIPVRSVERDLKSSLNAESTLTNTFISSPAPVSVKVTTDIIGGSPREDNLSYVQRIKNTLKTTSLASPAVIESNLLIEGSDIQKVTIVKAGDNFMYRDLVAYNALTPNTVQDFQYVKAGEGLDPGTKGHSAYINNFPAETEVIDGATSVVFPEEGPNAWVTELTNEQYRGLYSLSDGYRVTTDQYQIISQPSFSLESLNTFIKSDGARRNNLLVWPDEIRLEGTSVVLGKSPQATEDLDVRISLNELSQIEADLQEEGQIESILTQIKEKQQKEVYANLAPILHKTVYQHTGVSLEARITTTDLTAYGEMAYMTVLRNDAVYIAHDGYGFAYRKQPQFLIRLNYDNYGDDADLRAKDIAEFESTFGINPEDAGLVGSEILKTGIGNDIYWFFNAYIVDSNALDEEVMMGSNRVFDSTGGINQYLQKAKVWIEPNVTYDFKVDITETLGTTVYYKESDLESYVSILSKGATYPNYVPQAGSTLSTGNSSVDVLNSTRGNVGIGVGQTKGYEWKIDSFFMRSIVQTFPMHLFKFNIDNSKWGDTSLSFNIDYWGVGYDPNRYALAGNTSNSATKAVVWNPNTLEWEEIGKHTATIANSANLKKISKTFSNLNTYIDENGYLYVAASANNIGPSFSDNVDHNLETYYIQLSNPRAGKKHLGNAVDAYCFAPSTIIEKEVTVFVDNNEAIAFIPYACDLLEVREALTQSEIDPADYQVFNTHIGDTYGVNMQIKLAFVEGYNGASLSIIYRAWSQAAPIQDYLDDPEHRYPAVSIAAKSMPLCIVSINSLEFKGFLQEEDARKILVDYINSIADGVLDKSDLIQALYSQGATYVDLNMSINLKQYDPQFSYVSINFTDSRYEIPANSFGNFYTDLNEISGVIKV